jgi:adenylate cyclase
MFVDIRSFTAAARSRTPAEVVERLDAVFEILVDAVDRHNGIVNKFLGDGLLAIFGAPIDDPLEAANAVEAAREMLSAIDASNVGNPWPIRLGIGIHVGQAVAGTVGSPYGHRRHGESGLAPREPQQASGLAAHRLRHRS